MENVTIKKVDGMLLVEELNPDGSSSIGSPENQFSLSMVKIFRQECISKKYSGEIIDKAIIGFVSNILFEREQVIERLALKNNPELAPIVPITSYGLMQHIWRYLELSRKYKKCMDEAQTTPKEEMQ